MTFRGPALVVWLLLADGAAIAQTRVAPAGASACSGCHAISKSVETPAPRLMGRAPADIVAAMQAFKSGARAGTIMDRIAKGFTDTEVQAIAAWYGAQKTERAR